MLAALRQRITQRALHPAARQMSSYTERMEKTGRPVSPHVFIYRFPTIAISSIMMRISGVVLTVGTTGIAYSALLSGSQATTDLMTDIGNSSVGAVAKFAVAYPLVYHMFGAARHAVWDLTAKGFTNQQMLQSSYAIAGASTVLSLAIAVASLPPSKSEKK
ncbi:hypothetical protein AB1Y20_013124 [Prymnesium parvum]|uniref:Succinate dehydrogenase cytochrome b560 subunit, mitochondrial n=1 Tax=Prymnesium parvum TaxID=97485 RepID=A0AB34ILB0_PRYPA